jgi:phage N-6-adenine-methyltransferase
MMNAPLAIREAESLPALIDRASARLAGARSAGEVLEARDAARAALALAKVMQAANETQADCLRIIARAEIRMADEIDAGQARGELQTAGGDRKTIVRSSDNDPGTLDELGVSRQRLSEWREMRDAGEDVVEGAIESALAEGRAPTKADIRNHFRALPSSGNNEWYTPSEFVEMARSVLGDFDLDPASNPLAQQTVRAATFYTQHDDGLAKEWHGRVWMNPPYSPASLIAAFVDKTMTELDTGNVSAAIVLVNNATDSRWFQTLASRADAICFPAGRIKFMSPDGVVGSPMQGQTFFYYGEAVTKFAEVFGPIGFVVPGAIAGIEPLTQ